MKCVPLSELILFTIPYQGIICPNSIMETVLTVALTPGTASTQWVKWSITTSKYFHCWIWGSLVKSTWILQKGLRANSWPPQVIFLIAFLLIFDKVHIYQLSVLLSQTLLYNHDSLKTHQREFGYLNGSFGVFCINTSLVRGLFNICLLSGSLQIPASFFSAPISPNLSSSCLLNLGISDPLSFAVRTIITLSSPFSIASFASLLARLFPLMAMAILFWYPLIQTTAISSGNLRAPKTSSINLSCISPFPQVNFSYKNWTAWVYTSIHNWQYLSNPKICLISFFGVGLLATPSQNVLHWDISDEVCS